MSILKKQTKNGDIEIRIKKNGHWHVATGKTLLQALKKLNLPVYL
jgi:ribosomal protein L1